MGRLWSDVKSGVESRLRRKHPGESDDINVLAKALKRSHTLTDRTKRSIVRYMASARQFSDKAGRDTWSGMSTLLNAILATDFSHNMETWLKETFSQGIPSVYDKAVDAFYNTTYVGGGQLHRLVDGNHTLWDMWERVRDALPDDNLLQEVVRYATAFSKDLATPVGIPIFGMSLDSYHQVADYLRDTFGIERTWFRDLLHVNGAEVLGTSVAAIAVALRWNKAETAEFSRLVGSLGISSVVSANPALAVVAIVTLAKALMRAKEKGDYGDIVDGLAKGGFGTGVFLATSAVIGGLGGPVWIGMLTGVCVWAVVNRATSNVTISDVRLFVERSVRPYLPAREAIPASD